MGVADRESIRDSSGELLATVSFAREQAEHVIKDMERGIDIFVGELTDEQWEVIVSEFPNYSDEAKYMFNELVEEVCSRKHADTPTWMEWRTNNG